MKTLIIIQARMGGTRFPGKIQEQLAGMPVLEHVVRRARHKGYTVCIAAPVESADQMGWSYRFRHAVPDNRGAPGFVPVYFASEPEDDVLARVAATARWANDMARFTTAEGGYGCIVRLTADCPFVPVAAIDAVSEAVTSGKNDYCETRSDPSERPNGIDAQAFTLDLLLEAHQKAQAPEMREHLTPALKGWAKRPGRVLQLEGMRLDDLPGFRITVDTMADMARYRRMCGELTVDPTAGRPTLMELRDLHRARPDLFEVPLTAVTETRYEDDVYAKEA